MHSYRFGCSGWDYEEWIGPFYRSSQQSKLAAYSAVFDTVTHDKIVSPAAETSP